jgi:hypothetical protein
MPSYLAVNRKSSPAWWQAAIRHLFWSNQMILNDHPPGGKRYEQELVCVCISGMDNVVWRGIG